MKNFFILFFVLITQLAYSQNINKKELSPKVYESWKNISNQNITKDGKWVSYEINPQKGDGFLYLYNTVSNTLDSIARGENAVFSPTSDFIVFSIAPQYDTIRKMKLNRTPKSKLPKDSLGIWLLGSDSIIKIADVSKFEVTNKGKSWLLYVDESKTPKQKTEKTKKRWLFFKAKETPKKKEIKQDGDNIVLLQPIENKTIKLKNIDDYNFNYNGTDFFAIINTKLDSSVNSNIIKIDLESTIQDTIFNKTGTASKIGISRKGDKVAFLFSEDTAAQDKVFDLYFWNKTKSAAVKIADTTSLIKDWSPSINSKPRFSKDGSKLYFGIAPKPVQKPKDTLLAEEKYHVDIWNYQDLSLQPQQKIRARNEKRRTYLVQYDIADNKLTQLADTTLRIVRPAREGSSHFALGIDDLKYAREQSWDGWYSDYYAINIHDGSRELVLEHQQSYASISPFGNYIIYFNNTDKNWYVYDIKARKHINLTKDLKVKFYDELHDTPNPPSPYGLDGWYDNDKYVVVKDRYDLWRLDPSGRTEPLNITAGYGRKNTIRFNSITFDSDEHEYYNEENPHYLRSFNEKTKDAGYYRISLNAKEEPEMLIQSAHHYYYPVKAKEANAVIFRRSSFQEYPDLYFTNTEFKNPIKISNTNPQQSEYLWGSVELTNFKALDGQDLQGLIYKPENFDSTKKYPVIVYFYERYSDDIHRHYIPKPSHSIVNFTEYTSNGYIVFIPDITYKTGHPAKSAYNAIVGGTEFLKKFNWVDSKHIGIQGQSWGGYQVAMLVTMTDIYACAEAGAPVSNMISAYGGIRWGSGMSRAFQYERTQSRIGVSPWDSLDLYIENSPIFFAPKVNTPLLIMHNDKDGAVPWYQGIEYFNALRRLDKKVWMLSYNNDDHNLMKWPNRVDLSIRMMQFFDHYLKDKPMPEWMSIGLPAVDKGNKNAY
jgi:dipeptidyl aminopeptidase/acylaminoacyl peptidase